MTRYRITYNDPETGESKSVETETEDTFDPHFISAFSWAADYAYSLADKGRYHIQELTRK